MKNYLILFIDSVYLIRPLIIECEIERLIVRKEAPRDLNFKANYLSLIEKRAIASHLVWN